MRERRPEIVIDVGEERLRPLLRLAALRLGGLNGAFEPPPHGHVVQRRDAGGNAAPARVDDAHLGQAVLAVRAHERDLVLAGLRRQAERLADEFGGLAAHQFLRRIIGEAHIALRVENDHRVGAFLHQRHLRFGLRGDGALVAAVANLAARDRAADRERQRLQREQVRADAILRARLDRRGLDFGRFLADGDHGRVGPERDDTREERHLGRTARADIDDQRVEPRREQRVHALGARRETEKNVRRVGLRGVQRVAQGSAIADDMSRKRSGRGSASHRTGRWRNNARPNLLGLAHHRLALCPTSNLGERTHRHEGPARLDRYVLPCPAGVARLDVCS
jgi:hypothetical protein